MRRRLAEQPRVVAAQVLLGLVLVAGGFALGRTADSDDVPASTTAALAGARSQARAATRSLREARGATGRLNARVARERRRSASLRRRSLKLERSLRRTRRALARARRP